MADDSLRISIYRVTGTPFPFSYEMQQTIGCYTNERTASKVVQLIKDAISPEYPGGIDVKFEKQILEITRSSKGYCVKNHPEDQVFESLTRDELKRLAEMTFTSNMNQKPGSKESSEAFSIKESSEDHRMSNIGSLWRDQLQHFAVKASRGCLSLKQSVKKTLSSKVGSKDHISFVRDAFYKDGYKFASLTLKSSLAVLFIS